MPDSMRKRYLVALGNATRHFSGSTLVRILPFIEQDETLPQIEKLMKKELPEKQFLKELSILEETNTQET